MVLIGKPDRVEIPHAPGNFVHLRLLSGLDMLEARRAGVAQAMSMAKLTAGVEFTPEQMEAARAARPADAPADPLVSDLDAATLVDKGCVDWEGPAFMDGEKKVACTSQAKRDRLDAETFNWVASEVARRNRRPPTNASGSPPP